MSTAMLLAQYLDVDPLQLAATAGLLDGNVTGIPTLPPPPASARKERVHAQIQSITGLTEECKQRLLEVADEEIEGAGS